MPPGPPHAPGPEIARRGGGRVAARAARRQTAATTRTFFNAKTRISMAKRGPKPKTTGPALPPAATDPERIEPCSELTPGAAKEFRRLAEVLIALGTVGRADLAVLTEAARVKDLLDKAHRSADVLDAATIKVVNILTTQRRGLLRELGLTLQPSRSVVHSNAKSPSDNAEDDPIRKFIKISG